ncbi:MAG TPA: toxin-antitoxin system HicB family antitoxin [Phycisphaerae bacterium]|nr:toxin-antitoxin system HicB family antitoxin [Phycisphaerae bacterium]
MTRINIELPASVHERAKQLAERDGVSVDQFIATALAEKMSVLEAEAYFRERASRGTREAFDRALAKVPARPPLPGDEFPA